MSGVYTILPVKTFASAFGTDAAVCRNASPLQHVGDKHAPFLIIYADDDYATIDKMSEAMGQKLKEHKCAASVLRTKPVACGYQA